MCKQGKIPILEVKNNVKSQFNERTLTSNAFDNVLLTQISVEIDFRMHIIQNQCKNSHLPT